MWSFGFRSTRPFLVTARALKFRATCCTGYRNPALHSRRVCRSRRIISKDALVRRGLLRNVQAKEPEVNFQFFRERGVVVVRGKQEAAERAAGLLQSALHGGGTDGNGVRREREGCSHSRPVCVGVSTLFSVHLLYRIISCHIISYSIVPMRDDVVAEHETYRYHTSERRDMFFRRTMQRLLSRHFLWIHGLISTPRPPLLPPATVRSRPCHSFCAPT